MAPYEERARAGPAPEDHGTMKLLLVDDHPLFGVGFAHALTHARPDFEVQTALSLAEGVARASQCAPDIVLIDYRLGGEDGLEGLRLFGARHPLVSRLMISGDEEPALAARARAAGAAGFIGKSRSVAHIAAALDEVAAGGESFDVLTSRTGLPVASLTPRQLEVLLLVAQGRQNKQIAAELAIAERTVKLHITALLDTMDARNRTHLLVQARRAGLWLAQE